MKRGKKMIALLCAMAVLIGVYFGTRLLTKDGKPVTETQGTFALTEHTVEELAGLSWAKEDISYSFQIEDGAWKTTDEPSWPVRQDSVQALANQLLGLQAKRKLENIGSLADYGLEAPAFSVTASWKDGGETTYSMGSATPFADGFYLSVSGQDGIVYTVASSLANAFGKAKKELVAMEEIPAVKDAARLRIGSALNAVKLAESKTVDPAQLWYNAETDEPLDGKQIEALLAKAAAITWNELVSASSTEEERSAWKLDESSATVLTAAGGDGSSRNLLIGAQNEAGDYYARLPESAMVYTVKGSAVNGLLAASPETLWIKAIMPLPYENLTFAEFSTPKGSFRLEKPAADQTEREESSNQASEADAAQKALWAQVTALTATERLTAEKTGDQILSIRAVHTNGMETTAIISEYSADSYQAVVDGKAPMLVPADKIDLLVRTVRAMQ